MEFDLSFSDLFIEHYFYIFVLYITKLLSSEILRIYYYKCTIPLSKNVSEKHTILFKGEFHFPDKVCFFKTRILVSRWECVEKHCFVFPFLTVRDYFLRAKVLLRNLASWNFRQPRSMGHFFHLICIEERRKENLNLK